MDGWIIQLIHTLKTSKVYKFLLFSICYLAAGGELWCVAKASLGSYDCAVVLNRDATITGTASRFACLVRRSIIIIKKVFFKLLS